VFAGLASLDGLASFAPKVVPAGVEFGASLREDWFCEADMVGYEAWWIGKDGLGIDIEL
jgi:hypothetical protein